MKWKELLEAAQKKAAAATAILEGDEPNVEEAKKLLAEAEVLREQAKALKAAGELEADADAQIKAFDAAAKEPPTDEGGLVVVEDETDKKAKDPNLFKSMGEFFQAVANEDRKIAPFKDSDGYDIGKALGDHVVGSMTAAKVAKAITGMSETVPADGGLLVGVDNQPGILARSYGVGQLVQRVQMYGISAGNNGMTFNADAETARTAGNRRGGVRYYWAAEGAEKTASAPTFRRIELNLNKIIGLVYATDELLQDAQALQSYIMTIMPEELTVGVENAIYNGTGAGQPLGILGAPCLVTQAAEAGQAAATIVSENVINMWSRRWVGARDYVWCVNQDVLPQLYQMNLGVGTGGALTFMPPGGLSGAMYGTLFGRPVLELEQCPTLGTVGDIALCSWNEYLMIEKGGMQSASSIHVRFIFDETVFRFVYRCDGQPAWNQPLTPMNSTVTQGPFVVLATRP
jgi:HK97 family phage major capsid protein